MKVWIGKDGTGALVDAADAHVSVFDHGFTVAEGIFETMKFVDGRIFLWPWHLERLHYSASVINLRLPSDDALTQLVCAVVDASTVTGVGRLRLTITCSNGEVHDAGGAGATVVGTAFPARQPAATAQLRTVAWPRNERNPLVFAKSTSYAENVLALQYAKSAGATEALFFNTQGLLTEGSAANVFVVCDGVVLTPRLADGILAGVTRRFVMTLGSTDIRIEEAAISRDVLDAADEVFLTSSLRDIQPVDRVDDRAYHRGPVTEELRKRFAQAAAADWCWLRTGP